MTILLQWSLLATGLASALATPLSTSPNFIPSGEPLTLAPLIANEHPHGSINNSYIVILKDGLAPALKMNHLNFLDKVHLEDPFFGGDFSGLRHIYDGHINGYSGVFTDNVVEQLRKSPEVEYVEKDQLVRTMDVQRGAPWGLARISHRPRLTFSTFTKYEYNHDGGEGVDVYVVDTGINTDHVEFEGRASWGKTIPQNDVDEDGNGHGTHCAGTIASRKYGVAKNANVIAVKVLGSNGSGSMSDVVAGVVWAATSARAKLDAATAESVVTGRQSKHKGSVANMSLGGGKSRALDQAVNRAVDSGLHFAVAAGNDNRDACNYSPAAAEQAVTVGASTITDERAYFSNFGKCVDVFGPGLNILSTWTGSRTATNTISGTSMASPHTAGLLAYLLSIYPSIQFDPQFNDEGTLLSLHNQQYFSSSSVYSIARASLPRWIASFFPPPALLETVTAPIPKTLTPEQLKKALIALSTKDVIDNLPEKTVNLLLFNNATIA